MDLIAMLEFLHFLLVAALMPVVALIPGYLLARAFSRREGAELVALSLAASFAILGFSAFVAYLSGTDQSLVNMGIWFVASAIPLAVLVVRGKPLLPRLDGDDKLLVAAMAIFYGALICEQALVPVYGGAYWFGDWWLHYDVARFYLERGPLDMHWFNTYTVPTRTPLFNLAASFLLSLFGNPFWVFQIAGSMMNCAFIAPAYLLARRLFGGKASLVLLFFVFLSPALSVNAAYTWPKLFSVFFVLLSAYYYLGIRGLLARNERVSGGGVALCALSAGLAFMAHNTALTYFAAMVLDLALLLVFFRRGIGWMNAGKALVLLAFIIAPWYLWIYANYGWTGVVSANVTSSSGFIIKGWWEDKWLNILGTIAPKFQLDWLFIYLGGANYDLGKVAECGACMSTLYNALVRYYYDNLAGAMTFTLIVSAAAGLLATGAWRRFSPPGIRNLVLSPHFAIALMVIVSFAGAFYATPYLDEKGWVPIIFPIALVLLAYLSAAAAPVFGTLVLLGAAAEFIAIRWSHLLLLAFGYVGGAVEGNLELKLANSLVFISDYIGEWRVLLLPVAVALQAYFVYLIYGQISAANRPRHPRSRTHD